jgi:hypothetical protein
MSKANIVTGSTGEGGSTICKRATRKINLRFLQTLSLLDVQYLRRVLRALGLQVVVVVI